jgi:sulfur-oxidizing protein SoxZ
MNIKIRSLRGEAYTEIKLLLSHPMENGRNRDMNGELIAAHFIRELTITLNDKTVVHTHLGGSMSKDPFFTFRLKKTLPGDRLSVSWRDNQGLSDQAEHVIE